MYLRELVLLKYPTNHNLFIDYNVHGYKKYEALTLIAYYVGKISLGLYASEFLLTGTKYKIDNVISNMLHGNLKFYVPKLKNCVINDICCFQNIDKYSNSSSSLFYNSSEKVYEGIVRTVNYSMNDKMMYTINVLNHVNTENFYVKINAQNNTVISQHHIKCLGDLPCHPNAHIKGFEDARYFIYNNQKYMVATSLEYGEHSHPSIIICKLDYDNNIAKVVAQKYNNHMCQKNWAPILYDNSACFIYSYSPFIVLKMNEETMVVDEIINRSGSKYNMSRFRGSSNYIAINNFTNNEQFYIGIIHEVIVDDPRRYIHRFVKMDTELNVIDISEPFYFMEFFVEFVLSLHYNNDENMLIIPFSVRDNKTFLCKLKIDDIPWYGNIEEKIIKNLV
jgi:hypothetical protein